MSTGIAEIPGSPFDYTERDRQQHFRRHLARLLEGGYQATAIHVDRYNHIYNSGESDDGIYVLRQGQVKLTVDSPGGKRCMLGVCTSGDVFGDLSLLSGERAETAVAMRPSLLHRLPASRFLQLLDHDGFHETYLRYLSACVLRQQQVVVDMVTLESERRLASCLLSLCDQLGVEHGPGIRIDARLTREELGELVGTTRSRVGLFLRHFEQAGLIELANCTIVVTDLQGLDTYVKSGWL